MYTLILAILCFFLPGCGPHKEKSLTAAVQHPTQESPHKKRIFNESDVKRQEAALLDIAIPTYQQRLPLFCEDQYTGQVVLGYQTDCESEAHRAFFCKQMERYGWQLRREFKGPELLLEFEKPTRSCAYSIRPRTSYFGHPKGTDVVIYVEDNSVVY